MAIKSYNGTTYDDSVDYSAAIEQAKKSGQDTSALEAAREAKIADKYGGKEPTMYGSDKTYSQVKNDTSDAGRQTISNAVQTSSKVNNYDYTGQSNVSTNNADYYGGHVGLNADMSRNRNLAGMSVKQGQYTVTYDKNGYAVSAKKDGGASATHSPQTSHANDTVYHKLAYDAAAQGNWDLVGQYLNLISETYGRTGPATGSDPGLNLKAANLYQMELQNQFKYDDTAYYNYRYDQVHGQNSSAVFDATGGAIKSYSDLVKAYQQNGFDPTAAAEMAQKVVDSQVAKNPGVYNNPGSWIQGADGSGNKIPTTVGVQNLPTTGGNSALDLPMSGGGNVSGNINIGGGGGSYKPGSLGDYLDDWLAAAQQQQTNTIDFGTNQAVLDLIRQQQDAEAQFQEQRNQIAIDEAKAKDNQALYAESRGDKGGIGAAQYDSIMNTAAQNRLQVNSAQQKLATDTARQIADLRAQGEYEKADALLSLSQQYLAQLINLEQWSMEYNLSVAQFNASLQQWAAEYEMAVADLTGYYNGTPTLKNQQYQNELALTQQNQMASAGETLLSAGIMPSASQLAAMGLTQAQAQDYITAAQLAEASKNPTKGGGPTNDTAVDKSDVYRWLLLNGATDEGTAYQILRNNGYGTTDANKYASYFGDNYDSVKENYDSEQDAIRQNKVDIVETGYARLGDYAKSLYQAFTGTAFTEKDQKAVAENAKNAGNITEAEYEFLKAMFVWA